ncbi:MAG: TIGR04282 family arsenosugar biosynthesis glycosyltransferase [Gammaproteobacteria bacterium]|nr:TIGR04282 family arsenosugar biosynthesis glycosyltransferase [Gammaproteobacteria bacterium]
MQSAPTPTNLPGSIIKQKTALLVFTRTPDPGNVKTRLLSVMDAPRAAAIQAGLLQRTLETARASTAVDIELWCTPTAQHPLLLELGDRFSLALRKQAGAGLGERMSSAMEQALERYRHMALIGSDCMDLAASDIDLALEQLAAGTDIVLGPALDGGYYLIGLSRLYRQLFAGIEWGTDRVLEQTRERVAQLGLKLFELPVRRDLDRPEDLRYL